MARNGGSHKKIGRRAFLRDVGSSVVALTAGAMGLPSLLAAKPARAARAQAVFSQGPGVGPIMAEEPYAGNWKTWVLRSGRDIRLPAPPSPTSAEAMNELAQLRRAQVDRTQAQIDIALAETLKIAALSFFKDVERLSCCAE